MMGQVRTVAAAMLLLITLLYVHGASTLAKTDLNEATDLLTSSEGNVSTDLPLNVTNFTCISLEYTNLTCTWTEPQNNLRTQYILQDFLHDNELFKRICPVPIKPSGCQYRLDTKPAYVRNQETLSFLLVGKNSLGESKQYFKIKHYEIVKPGMPSFVQFTNVTETSMVINISGPKSLQHGEFFAGLVYSIKYYSVSMPLNITKEMSVTSETGNVILELRDLVPDTKYNFEVRCHLNIKSDRFIWSDTKNATESTKSDECDCGPYGLCEFENGQKKCKCTPLSIEFEGKCVECDCGKFSKSCSISTNGTKICVCNSDYVEADGLCTKCDCGDNGLCKIASGQKKCICSPSYVEVREKCQECECGEATYSCVLDSSGKKKCACLPRFEENNGSCAECYCGRFGRCRYEDGLRKCSCNLYYSERNGTCEYCSCGEKSSSCYFDSDLNQRCKCYKGYAEKDGRCEECNCGNYGSCVFENGRKRCKCQSPTVEINGWCSIITTITADTDVERSTFLHTTTTHVPITAKSTIQTSTTRACDCGENSIDCHLNMQGENICDCHCGYLQNHGRCEECNCGPYAGCTFENGLKKCICMPFAVEVNGVCVDFGTTSAGTSDPSITSTIVSSTAEECDCGPRGKCVFVNEEKMCVCDSYTSEKDGKCVDCYCGENAKSCSFNRWGQKICRCKSGYSQVFGFCYDCNCGANADYCSYTKDGTKQCKCDVGYAQVNGKCSAICSGNKCVHGICEIEENDFKCRCYKGFTGRHCEEKIQIQPISDKHDLLMIMILSVTLAIFVLLSGMFCFWTRILSKLSRK